MPYVIKEAPNYELVTLDYLLLAPQVSARKPGELTEVPHDLVKIRADLWQLSRVPHDAFNWLEISTPRDFVE